MYCPQCKKEVEGKKSGIDDTSKARVGVPSKPIQLKQCEICGYLFININKETINKEFWQREHDIPLKASYLTLMAVHGNLCLALRHPMNRGESRVLVVQFVKSLGEYLVHVGALTEEQLVAVQQLEAEEGSEEFR